MLQAYFSRRLVYPGPGTRKLLGIGPCAPNSRMVNHIGAGEMAEASAILGSLGNAMGPSCKKLVGMLGLTLESNGFAEEFLVCELGANLEDAGTRSPPNHWPEDFAIVTDAFRSVYTEAQRQLWRKARGESGLHM